MRAGAVAWPASTLVVSEVQTGGASASDEFVEIANQGGAAADLLGLEVVYATSSGSTVTRKATWATTFVLDPGRRVLIANGSGTFAGMADVTYSSGFAATGGAIALRVVGGAVIDAVGWGDATNSFVEGTPAGAPPAGSSLERAPGGAAGNGTDTNQNSLDWFVQSVPSPQGSSAPPVPGSVPTPTPTPTPTPRPPRPPRRLPRRPRRRPPRRRPRPRPRRLRRPRRLPTPTPITTPTPTPTPPYADPDADADTDLDHLDRGCTGAS